MATLPHAEIEQTERKLTLEEAAAELHAIVEAHFDDLGLTEVERDRRYTSLGESLDAKDAATSRA